MEDIIRNTQANFSRPADTTAYASGDLVANSTTAGSVTPMSWIVGENNFPELFIRRVKVKKSGTSTTSASFRLHLYGSSPTVANGDNGALSSTESSYIGAFDVTVDRAFSDAAVGLGVPVVGSEISLRISSGRTIYGLLEARAAYTPSSGETFTVSLEYWR